VEVSDAECGFVCFFALVKDFHGPFVGFDMQGSRSRMQKAKSRKRQDFRGA
jgi:hypothetical protein